MTSKLSKISKASRTEIKVIEQDQPLQGTIYFILYTIFYSLAFLCAAYLYDRNPDLVPFQMLTMRATFALTCLTIFYNKELKKAIWDDIDLKSSPPLIFRSLQGCYDDFISFTATAVIPLTMISIINNLSPLTTVVLAYYVLKERIRAFEIFIIILTVVGIFDVVIFADSDSSSSGT